MTVLHPFSTKAVTKTLLKTRIWWQNSYQNIFVVLVVWMFCRTKTSKNSRLQRPIENLFFPFIQIVKYCMVIWPLMRAMGEGRLLEVGACTRKYGELSLSVLVFRSFSMCWLKWSSHIPIPSVPDTFQWSLCKHHWVFSTFSKWLYLDFLFQVLDHKPASHDDYCFCFGWKSVVLLMKRIAINLINN